MAARKAAGNQPIGGRVMTLADAAQEVQTFPAGNPTQDVGLIDDDEPSPLDRAQQVIEELSGTDEALTGKINVYRDRPGKREAFLYECGIPDWPTKGFAHIAETYGTGTYRVRVWAGGAMRVNRLIDVEAPDVERAPAAAPAPDDSLKQLGGMFAATLERMGAMLVDTIRATQSAQVSQASNLQSTLETMKAMREAMGYNTAPADPLANIKPVLEIVKQLQDMGGGGGDGGGDGWMGKMFDKFGPVLAQVLEQRVAPPQTVAGATVEHPAPATLPAPAAPVPAVPVVSGAPAPQPVTEDEMYAIIIKAFLHKMVQAAAHGEDIEPHAQQIAEHGSERALQDLCDRPDWLNVLSGYEPEVRNFAPWFERLRARVDELTAENEDDTTPGNAP